MSYLSRLTANLFIAAMTIKSPLTLTRHKQGQEVIHSKFNSIPVMQQSKGSSFYTHPIANQSRGRGWRGAVPRVNIQSSEGVGVTRCRVWV